MGLVAKQVLHSWGWGWVGLTLGGVGFILVFMKVIKVPVWLHQLMELYSSRDDEDRRDRAMAAVVVLIGLVGLYYFFI